MKVATEHLICLKTFIAKFDTLKVQSWKEIG